MCTPVSSLPNRMEHLQPLKAASSCLSSGFHPQGKPCSDLHHHQVVLLALDFTKRIVNVDPWSLLSLTQRRVLDIRLCGRLQCGSSSPVIVWYCAVRTCPSSPP